MSRIISVVNQKGGVGKTTTALNLAAYLAAAGKFVLLVDIDPQANATSGAGIDNRSLEKGLYHSLVTDVSLSDVIMARPGKDFRIAPSDPSLAGANVELVNLEDREFRLHNALLEIRNDYDYILIDCPPSLGLLTLNGIVGADEVLIPVQAEYYALEGLGQLLNTINLVQENLKPELSVLGAVLTMYERRYKLSSQVFNELYRYFPNRIFRSVIPRNVRLTEAPSHGLTILEYDPRCRGARAYEKLARELLLMEP